MQSAHRRIGAAVSAVAVGLLGVIAMPAVASASSSSTFWVNNTVAAVSGHGSSCSQPGYTSLQAAVTAAETHASATIKVCPGTYAEQVQVTQPSRLTIEASNPKVGATLTVPATPANSTTPCDGTGATPWGYQPDQNGFTVCGTHATTVTVKDLTFDEAWPSGTCNDSLYGILVGGGDTLVMTNSAVVAGGAVPINGCQGGIGIQVGMAWTTPVERGHLTLTNATVSGYQKNGVTVDGAGSTAKISYDSVTGAGQTTQTAQNGIQISNGGYATISHTTVSGNECNNSTCGANALTDYQATGVLFYGAKKGSSIVSSTLTHNDIGAYFYSTRATLSSSAEDSLKFSTVLNNRYEGVVLDQGRHLLASDRIQGGKVGLMALQYNGQAYGDYALITSCKLTKSTSAAVQILSDQASSGDKPGNLTFKSTTIKGPILSNSSSYTVTFEK